MPESIIPITTLLSPFSTSHPVYASIRFRWYCEDICGNEIEQYPAAYKNVFAIASTNSSDNKSSFSSYGHFIDMCAPGSNIYATVYNNSYASLSGTSMASPVAAGCAAIIKSHTPSYNALQVGEQLRVTSDDIYAVNGAYLNKLGKGRINMYNSLTANTPSIRFLNRQFHDGNDDLLSLELVEAIANTFL